MTTSNLRVVVRTEGVERALGLLAPTVQSNLTKFLTAFAVRLMGQIQNNIIEIFHSNGRLFNSVYVTRREDVIVATVRDVPYARILEVGGTTRPHVILPRNVSILAWEGPAGLVFAKRVNHPGSNFPARPYMSLALTQLRGEFEDGIRGVVAKSGMI